MKSGLNTLSEAGSRPVSRLIRHTTRSPIARSLWSIHDVDLCVGIHLLQLEELRRRIFELIAADPAVDLLVCALTGVIPGLTEDYAGDILDHLRRARQPTALTWNSWLMDTPAYADLVASLSDSVGVDKLVGRTSHWGNEKWRSKLHAQQRCGFGTVADSAIVVPSIVWAKLGALVEGTRRASEALGL